MKKILKIIPNIIRKYEIHKEIIQLIDRRNYLIANGFPFAEKIDAKIAKLEQEKDSL